MIWLTYLLIGLGALLSLWLVAFIISLFVYIPLVARLITETASVPPRPPDALPSGQTVRLATRYRQRIHATVWEPPQDLPARGTAILCHPYQQSRWYMAGLSQHLTAAGWNVLALDFCGHGESPSPDGYRPVGWVSQYEMWDIEAALRFVRKRYASHGDVWLLGMSKGANTALCAAAIWDEIKLVVADGAFGSLPMIEYYYRRLVENNSRLAPLWSRLPRFWVYIYLRPAMWLAARKCRCRFLPDMALLPRVKQPVLLIRGERDRVVSQEVTLHVKQNLRCPVEMLTIPKARHNGSFATDPDTYVRSVLSMVDTVLPPAPPFAITLKPAVPEPNESKPARRVRFNARS